MADRPISAPISSRPHVEYLVRPLCDVDEVRRLLQTDRAYAAYALGQLQPHLFVRTECWLSRGAQGQALLMHSHGGLGNALFALGAADALEVALRLHPGPHYTFLTCQEHHIEAILRHFRMPEHHSVVRMVVTRETFSDVGGEVRALGGWDVADINRLYRSDGTPTYYSARNIDEAVYYGAKEAGSLVAVAGTHVVSALDGIAVAGNVFVQPQYRGRGLGERVTSAVTRHLLGTCREVVLSVDPLNVSAVRAYERLGYREVGRLVEGSALRRTAGIAALLRRGIAALQGHRYGAELVRLAE